MILVLLGYMASGKSYIGENLAKILDYNFIDLDDYIENEEKLTINQIFSNKGEIYFRKKENACLNKLISNKTNTVISLGGGTPCYSNNMNLLLNTPNIKTIYLQVAIPNLVDRILTEPNNRPVIAHLNSKEELQEFIGKHLFERLPFYSKAEFIIDANRNKNDIIESILMKLF